ncbi:hypothetical protein D9M73_261310 [compost metagenome]
MAGKKSAEISRVLEPELVADLIHRIPGEQQKPLGLLHQPLEHQAFGRHIGNTPANIIQARLGNLQQLRITAQRQMLEVMRLDVQIEALENVQVFAA